MLHGQLICKNNPDPAGSIDLINESKIGGNMILTYGCGSILDGSGGQPEPIAGRMWHHVW